MTWEWAAAAFVVLVFAVSLWCSWTATRLDRLHVRCEATRAAVSEQLARRAALTIQLVASMTDTGRPGDAAHAARDAAARALAAHGADRWEAESTITRLLRDPALCGRSAESENRVSAESQNCVSAESQALRRAVEDSQHRASITRRIHNDTAALALALHRRRRVRWFRLAGRSQPPAMIEYDDGSS